MAMPDNGFDEWGGYMSAKITKLEEQFASASTHFRETNLFAGISIYVNGLTNPSSDELKRLMMIHGGTYHIYERSHTTYIIASNLPDVKVRNMDTSKIISPQWVVDCIKENKILDYTNYLLNTNKKRSQPQISFSVQRQKKKFNVNESEPMAVDEEERDVADILHDLEKVNDKANNPSTSKSNAKTSSVARTAVDPNFLSEFYNNSRLHHISALGAGFKQYISELREKHSGLFPQRQTLRDSLAKVRNFIKSDQLIMHIDMDCFFVSVGLRNHPYLRGQPVAVTHSKGGSGDVPVHPGADRKAELDLFVKKLENQLHKNILADKVRGAFDGKSSLSEIASCSYEAREKGIRNGMFVGHALKLCPNLKTIPYDFEGYKEVAYTLYNTVAQYTLDIEAVSCDEMFVNLTELVNDLQIDPMDFVTFVREEVRQKTSCPCSAGVGGNKLQARMATKKAKPDGQFYLKADAVEEYMSSISIKDLPGVGSSTMSILEEMNLATCGDLQLVSLGRLQGAVGKKFGETLYQFCRGIDTRPLVYGQIRKSVSAEVNYGIRFKEYSELETFLRQLCTEVHTRLTDIKRKGKCITLKVMIRAKDAPKETAKFMGHGVCDYLTKAVSLSDYTCDLESITRTVLTTMKAMNIPPQELRGIGIQINKLDEPNEVREKKENIIKNMFNKAAERQKSKPPPIEEKPTKTEEKTAGVHTKSVAVVSRGKGKSRQKVKAAKTPDIMGMLKNAAASKRPSPSLSDLPDDIDPGVFAELPEDIRNEILQSHARAKPKVQTQKVKSPQKHTKVDEDFLRALPPELRREVELEIAGTSSGGGKPPPPSISPDNIFRQPERIQLLLEWVKSCTTPENYDVELISEHGREFVRAKKINDIYDPLIYLCRIINRFGSCGWHMAYNVIVEAVQNQMLFTYGNRLFLGEKIECKQCCEH